VKYLLLILVVPGTIPLLLLAIRSVVRTAQRIRREDEDAERAVRIQRDYSVPDYAVEPPKGRRVQPRAVDGPTSNYKEVGRWL
jgi:hypothetical protein